MKHETDQNVDTLVQCPVGALVLVSLKRLRIVFSIGRTPQMLTGCEVALWQRLQTDRRRLEFIGGRLAAKLAIARLSTDNIALCNIEVARSESGKPVVRGMMGPVTEVSISHTREWAVALAVPGQAPCGIDIEDRTSRVRLSGDYFHKSEIELAARIGPKRHWVLKEALAKLSSKGLGGDPHSVKLVEARSPSEAAICQRQSTVHAFSGVRRSLAVGIALGRT
ncbi:4'-phosphopantetheinyl transferase family protein [Bradyrhizobium tropiciagri]|uniref:4'-phosphopantetheinyl transferase family protein n=1 Tax=Bradyrhizobium tropiciagri TaxID=312253 RepID=UPI00067CC9E0|nr:4'-phosphopantetheinyl transferase superfamily protein [Bradyrhizobium tropiciagri]